MSSMQSRTQAGVHEATGTSASAKKLMMERDIGIGPLPTISERLKKLQPSHELLEFYRQKIADFDGEHADMVQKVERYKATFESQHKQAWTLAQRDEEVRQLQQALSDMQLHLFQERDHVLRLYAENDRLKIQELEDRKKIQHLLGLSQPVEQETTYFHGESDPKLIGAVGPAADVISEIERKSQQDRSRGGHSTRKGPHVKLPQTDQIESLVLTIEALQAQIEDNARLWKEKEAALLEDRRVREEEFRNEQARDAERLQDVMDKLHHTQDLLYDSTRDYLELKFEHRQREQAWVEEKESLLRRIEEFKDDIDNYQTELTNAKVARDFAVEERSSLAQDTRKYRDTGTNVYRAGGRNGSLTGTRSETYATSTAGASSKKHVGRDTDDLVRQEMQNMAEMYREQCIQLEDELCRLKEERQVAKDMNSDRAKKLLKRLSLMKSRYEQLEQRRQLEAEGYKNSIKILRKRLSEVEKHLYRLAAEWTTRDGEDEMLSNVHTTSVRSKKVMGELNHLKQKVYNVENKVRHVHVT